MGYVARSLSLFAMVFAVPLHAAAAPSDDGSLLEATQWVLVAFVEEGVKTRPVEGTEITLAFPADDPSAYGSGGCNRYFGDYEVEDDTISFGSIGSTKMFCFGDGVMQQESRYFNALQSADSFKTTGSRLRISYGEGQGVLVFKRGE